MNDTMNITQTATATPTSTKIDLTNFWEQAEFNRYSIIAMGLIVVGCLGGIAAASMLVVGPLALSMVVFPAMFALIAMLAVAPMRWIIGLSTFSVIVNLIIIAFSYLA